ncbi:hypothetical protein KQX54_011310 [Cotesia glomerata]|uniref:Uncharacterized protein n=1 Tax=Cotesia glomerata TaxID=32391 RepID=A0AAV7IET2_COTGL|nr:hypothetical protein KQX54_011310 [Cotesia glomerata]
MMNCVLLLKDDASVLVDGACQIPDPLYKLIGSIICFYIPLGVMLLTYALTVRLLAEQRQNIGGTPGFDRHGTWRPLPTSTGSAGSSGTPQHTSAASTDTEPTTLDTQELWMPESKPPPSAVLALQAFGAEMLKLSKGLEGMGHFAGDQTPIVAPSTSHQHQQISLDRNSFRNGVPMKMRTAQRSRLSKWLLTCMKALQVGSNFGLLLVRLDIDGPTWNRKMNRRYDIAGTVPRSFPTPKPSTLFNPVRIAIFHPHV